MALFKKSELREVALKKSITKSIVEAKFTKLANSISDQKFDIFLSHSSLDAVEIEALSIELEGLGYTVYVDWIVDKSLDRTQVTGETASLLRNRMKNCKSLFFATSENSQHSRWMPWELGFFDGLKDKVAILPIVDDWKAGGDVYVGQEYLSIYPYVAKGTLKNTSIESLWIHETSSKYVKFDAWLSGSKPTLRT